MKTLQGHHLDDDRPCLMGKAYPLNPVQSKQPSHPKQQQNYRNKHGAEYHGTPTSVNVNDAYGGTRQLVRDLQQTGDSLISNE